MVLVSLLVKTHSQDLVQGLQDVIPEQGDLEIVARNGAFLTSKLVVFGVFPQIYEYLCTSCTSGHDTVTIVIPDLDVEVVREAFENLFNGDIKELSEIICIKTIFTIYCKLLCRVGFLWIFWHPGIFFKSAHWKDPLPKA